MRFRLRWVLGALLCPLLIFLFLLLSSLPHPAENSLGRPLLGDEKHIEADQSQNIADIHNGISMDDTPNYNVHIFYYPWYGNPPFDNGSYYHWNHNVLPGPNYPTKNTDRYEPPDEIGADFYPQLGCYSNRDPSILRQHFEWIRGSGVGTVVVSWYPPEHNTDQGHAWDDLMPTIFDAAHKEGLKIAFHIEPYKNRNISNLRENFAYILSRYGSHPAFYRYQRHSRDKAKPLFYVYDSYLIPDAEWQLLLRHGGEQSIRQTPIDSYVIGLLVEEKHKHNLVKAGYDGYYTYFAVNGFTFGSTWRNWNSLAHSARRMNMIFIPCVGPGYIDKSVRPWNQLNTRERGPSGEYYAQSWQSAINSRSELIGVTSFNEWHEGTQIEPAVPRNSSKRTYLDYQPMGPRFYLDLTLDWIKKFGARVRSKERNS